VKKFILGAGYLEDTVDSYALAERSEDFFCMMGVHPCRAKEPFIDY
jgi:Tat protein secretion system quality control protein TatD with DNase activity